jgi:hypothetical protein
MAVCYTMQELAATGGFSTSTAPPAAPNDMPRDSWMNDTDDLTGFGSKSPRAAAAAAGTAAATASAAPSDSWTADVSDATGFTAAGQKKQAEEAEEDNFGF